MAIPTSSGRAIPAPATSRLAMVFGILAFAFAGVLVGRTMRAENAHADTGHHAAQAAPAATSANTSVTTTAAPLPTLGPIAQNDAPVAPSTATDKAPASTSAKNAAKPSARGARLAAAAKAAAAAAAAAPAADPAPATASDPARSTSDAKPASCRLPYVVDGEGHRHYKVECL